MAPCAGALRRPISLCRLFHLEICSELGTWGPSSLPRGGCAPQKRNQRERRSPGSDWLEGQQVTQRCPSSGGCVAWAFDTRPVCYGADPPSQRPVVVRTEVRLVRLPHTRASRCPTRVGGSAVRAALSGQLA